MRADLVQRFVRTFQKALRAEMDAMHRRLGPFEIALSGGRRLDAEDGTHLYAFAALRADDKLVPGCECTLRCEKSEYLVRLTRIEGNRIEVESAVSIPLGGDGHALVVFPWFLYEKLLAVLEALPTSTTHFPATGLRLFGKTPPLLTCAPLALPHAGLNPSQRRAVERCAGSDLALVWGPPGTGKTRTLAHIACEWLQSSRRVLLTSTTNAAVDQALEALRALPEASPYFEEDRILRLSAGGGRPCEADLVRVLARRSHRTREELAAVEERRLALADGGSALAPQRRHGPPLRPSRQTGRGRGPGIGGHHHALCGAGPAGAPPAGRA